jgi:acyl-CoA synthetase (AMP-forming)/AMP-acid ligase II
LLSNFATLIHQRCLEFADSRSYTYLRGRAVDADGADRMTFLELDLQARRIAAWLARERHGKQPVLLLYSGGLEFVVTFLGCLYAGVIAVPTPVPLDARSIERVRRILRDADIGLVLMSSAVKATVGERLLGLARDGAVRFLETDTVAHASNDEWIAPELSQSSVALLQYTSGSASEPKGVIVTHGNLLDNEARIRAITASHEDDVMAGWLPHFHDMGLIGMLLHPLYVGADLIFMAPGTFMKRPIRWLELMSRHRVTHTAAPDFAYDLCARTATDSQVAELDLSAVRIAITGAEPVRARTLDRFMERFGRAGFKREAFTPCYGMAEVTLLASGGSTLGQPRVLNADAAALESGAILDAPPHEALQLVGNGRYTEGELQIVDPASATMLPARRVGEIWLRGPSVAVGYWRNAELTNDTFHAFTTDGDGPYLRTGDLGFVAEGEVYVTGRLKEMLIVNGRNLYPQDLESAISELHPSLYSGSAVVFSLPAERDSVVVIQELRENGVKDVPLQELKSRIKDTLVRSFGIAGPHVVLARRGSIPRTTSGKVQRQLARELFLKGQVTSLAAEAMTARAGAQANGTE